MDFISSDVFKKAVALNKDPSEVFPWTYLDIGKIFKVQSLETYHNAKYDRPSHILSLIDSDGEKVNVWSNDKLAKKLLRKNPKDIPYISSLGQTDIGGGRRKNSFDLHFEKSTFDYPI